MKDMRKKIRAILDQNSSGNLEQKSKEEIVEKLNIYHEELYFQNEELKNLTDTLTDTVNSLKTLFESAPVPYALVGEGYRLLDANGLFHRTFREVIVGQDVRTMFTAESQDLLYYLLRGLELNDKGHSLSTEKEVQTIEGKEQYYKIYGGKVLWKGKNAYLLSFAEMTTHHHYMKKIEALTYKDQLTGLYNRRFFNEELARLNTRENLPLGIIMGDVNGLKLTNDAFGHATGDELLKRTAQILRKLCRAEETIVRLGGDEFAILFPKVNEGEMKHLYNRIKVGCSNIPMMEINASMSVGYAHKTMVEQPMETILSGAEEMMYRNKLFTHTSQHRQIINSILSGLHIRHPREEQHSKRVSNLMTKVAEYLAYDESTVLKYKMIGLFHDLGKVAIDYKILDKTEPLSLEEVKEIRKHPEIGYRILKSAGSFKEMMDAVLQHHERVDGTGYPAGLKGEALTTETKILSICDAFDAMTSVRPYRTRLDYQTALEELKSKKGSHFDGEFVDIFVAMIQAQAQQEAEFLTRLS